MTTGPMLLDAQGSVSAVVELRDYQRAALDAVLANWQRGVKRQLVSLPTGAGKTVLAAHLIREAGLERTVFMVHRDELVRQSVKALRNVYPEMPIGVVQAERDETWAPVVIVSAQTVGREQRLRRLIEALRGQSVLFVSDECHHDAAPTRRKVISEVDAELLVGLTATPRRGDGAGLDAIYEQVAFHLPLIELIALGKLAPLKGLRIETAEDLDAVHTRAGEFVESELAKTVNTPARNRLIVESWQRHASDRQRTVAFCVDVRHALDLRDVFRAEGVRAEAILGETPSEERQRLFAAFHDGKVPVLTNCMVLTEGYDEPRIDCVLMARPTKSQGLYVQCVGRAARRAPGYKEDALIIDFVDNTARHSLVSLPTLAGRDLLKEPQPRDGGGGDEGMGSEADRKQGEIIDLLRLAETKRRLRETAARRVNLFAASDFRWRTLAPGILMAPARRREYIILVEQGDGDEYRPCRIGLFEDGPRYEWLFERPIDFEMAASIAESKASLNQLTEREPAWAQLPPTEKQIEYARLVGVRYRGGMTRGELSEAIDAARVLRAMKKLGLGGQQR